MILHICHKQLRGFLALLKTLVNYENQMDSTCQKAGELIARHVIYWVTESTPTKECVATAKFIILLFVRERKHNNKITYLINKIVN